ncbi:MAG: Tex family protein [Salibacteraceae bacterium]
MQIIKQLKEELNISESVIDKVLALLAEGATIPFIARYRKELTGGLDEVSLIEIKDRHQYWVTFIARKETILRAIHEQGKLTDALREKIEKCQLAVELEDLYLPYKTKRKSKGQKAIDAGLKPLAIFIQKQHNNHSVEDKAYQFVGGEIETAEMAIEGATHILAEWISENQWVRERMRTQFEKYAIAIGKVKKGKKEEGEKFKDYFDFSERCNRIAPHRVLALFRGDNEGVLNFKIEVDKEHALEQIERGLGRNYGHNLYVEKAIQDSYKRILQPNFESELKKQLKEKADVDSIGVFANNLRQLLLQSPLGAQATLAIDPGFRTGCKVAVLNASGDFLESVTIYPHPPQNKVMESEKTLRHLVQKYKIKAIAVGNGTAGIESETLCRKVFKDSEVSVFSVNEAGASIYSASEIAREEFGELDLTVRGAISIGRRLMDPLAELVKIDAKSIGVGQYQHDVNQPLLKQKLTEVVESCVNHVGVELNTASYPILSFVSGLGPGLAKKIVAYRKENGNFSNRKELLKVPKMGKKTFEQAAGFLRIEESNQPLDNTIIHPESYGVVKEIAQNEGVSVNELLLKKQINSSSLKPLEAKYGKLTIDFIANEIVRPTIDPREPLKEMQTNNVSSIEELIPGMKLTGTVNNITNFGAFVNIGLKESGLVHISHLSNTFVSDIHAVVQLNQQVDVTVLSVDLNRKRIQLSMKV